MARNYKKGLFSFRLDRGGEGDRSYRPRDLVGPLRRLITGMEYIQLGLLVSLLFAGMAGAYENAVMMGTGHHAFSPEVLRVVRTIGFPGAYVFNLLLTMPQELLPNLPGIAAVGSVVAEGVVFTSPIAKGFNRLMGTLAKRDSEKTGSNLLHNN